MTVIRDGEAQTREFSVGTRVWFGRLSDEEVDAYVATGEPVHVAGVHDRGLRCSIHRSYRGDHHNVVGISLPALRGALAGMGVGWHTLWKQPDAGMN